MFLLAVLAVVASYGVPRIIAEASAGTPAPPCPPRDLSTAKSTLADLELMADRDGLYSLVRDGTLDTYGLQEPAAWLDNPPAKPTTPPSPSRVDAGFEMRWWSRTSEHLGASLFVFANADSARAYVSEAASLRCRSGAVATVVSSPAGARAVVWTNPLGYLQTDVLFARGKVVYRLAAVAPGSAGKRPLRANVQRLLVVPERLACDLLYAGCYGPAPTELIALPRSQPSARSAIRG